MMKVSVLIPAYNEADRIGQTIRALGRVQAISEIIVVDDGSMDDTESQARKAGVRVIRHSRNYGKGAALYSAISASTGDVLVFLDADVGERATEIAKLLPPIFEGRADMTIAKFPPTAKKNGWGWVKGLAKRGIRRLASLELDAPLSGQRALRREVLSALGSLSAGYGVEVGMTIDAAKGGFRILEVPVDMQHREYGRTWKGFLHRGRQFVHVAIALAERWAYR
jgi:glycosyltransferase involved in cell wall biosynthesis